MWVQNNIRGNILICSVTIWFFIIIKIWQQLVYEKLMTLILLLFFVTVCVNVTVEENFSSQEFLNSKNIVVNFSALVKTTIQYSVKTVNFKAAGPITPPDCYKFNIIVSIYYMLNFDRIYKLSIYKIVNICEIFYLICKVGWWLPIIG